MTRRASRAVGRALRAAEARRFANHVPKIHELTMVPPAQLSDLVQFVDEIHRRKIPGDIVECGVWRGGASFVAARRLEKLGDKTRRLWMFDSYEGLPPPEEIDGATAMEWAADTKGATYHDNCTASVEDVAAAAEELGVLGRTRIVKGWFDDTLPSTKAEIGPIALLRIDADWHSSVVTCLEELYDQVSPGGIVHIDDYYLWDGCAVAVHEFLGARSLPHRIEQGHTAYFRKL